MEEIFNVYYGTICHTCKKPSESNDTMKFCSGCKLVQYCSIDHQRQDWLNHKELCKCVRNFMKKTNARHVFCDAINIEPGDILSWNTLRASLMKLVEISLKRSLTIVESQMILFPPVCSYCHLYTANKMFVCHSCKSVLYCSEDHQHKDQNHLSFCKLLARSFQVDMLRYHEQTSMFDFMGFVFQCNVKKFPENMEIFIESLTTSLTNKGICLSEPLSYALTLVFVISNVVKINTNQLTFHIVGADSMEFLAMQTFPLIYHLLPHIIHLNIVLIGPNVLVESDSLPLCVDDSNLNLSSVIALYHDYVVSPKFVKPDIVAVLNCGFCEFHANPEKDVWKQSLSSILSVGSSLLIITSYTANESMLDLQILRESRSKDLEFNEIMKCKKNPFASLYPHRDWQSQGVYYANNYISVVKT